jgi:ribosomal protein L22
MKKYYYGFRFYDECNTNIGEAFIFEYKKNRDLWVSNKKPCSSKYSLGGERIACTKSELRKLCCFKTPKKFDKLISDVISYATQEIEKEKGIDTITLKIKKLLFT